MWKFVEFTEFPSRVECVTAATDRRRIFVIFLERYRKLDENKNLRMGTNFKVSEEVIHNKVKNNERS